MKKKTKKKPYFYRRANIDQTQNVTNEAISQNVIINNQKRNENRNQNDVHRNNRDKKIIRKNNRNDCEKQSFNKFKMTCYYYSKIKHLKNKCKNFIVDQKTKKNSNFTTQSQSQRSKKITKNRYDTCSSKSKC